MTSLRPEDRPTAAAVASALDNLGPALGEWSITSTQPIVVGKSTVATSWGNDTPAEDGRHVVTGPVSVPRDGPGGTTSDGSSAWPRSRPSPSSPDWPR